MMKMITCKECKHWDNGACNSVKFVDTSIYEDSWCEHRESTSDELEYFDNESYKAGFRTGKDFGCVHGEKI